MASVGNILKKEREKRKLSLNDISEETKIGINYLKAIESDDYTIFPGETYIIGFIRNYARALGLVPSEVVSQYKSMKIETPFREKTESAYFEEEEKTKKGKDRVKEALPSIMDKAGELLKTKKRSRKRLDAEPIEVIEIREHQLGAKRKRKKDLDQKPFSPAQIKDRIVINPILIVGVVSALIFLVLFIILVRSIIINVSSSEKKAIYTDLSEIKYLEFDQDILRYDFGFSEYYKIKLGENFHTIMFEQLTPAMDINVSSNQKEAGKQTISFHFNDINMQLVPGEEQSLDFDLDGEKDISVKINSMAHDLINASVKKLHPFIVAVSEDTNMAVETSPTNVKKEKAKGEVIPPEKRKIVFEAVVRERTYIKSFLDGREQDGKIYYPRDKVYFEARDVMQLKIGNAGGIVAKINGKEQKLGRRGEIANKVIKWEKDQYDDNIYNLIIKDWQ
ncbi:MAG: helix-turn-helix domain-containing protein [Spirochaetes bacterium]|nr:helix-turn-helix domain-containing protein [Spirochaetota bacterium]